MVGNLASLPRIQIADLIPEDGLPPESYKTAISNLWHSFNRFNAAVIQLPQSDNPLLTLSMDSARMYFQLKGSGIQSLNQPSRVGEDPANDWRRNSGYFPEPFKGKESFEFRPGTGNSTFGEEEEEMPSSTFPFLYGKLGSISRLVLESIARALDLRSHSFSELLDNCPLKANETGSSILAAVCQGRRAFVRDLPLTLPPPSLESAVSGTTPVLPSFSLGFSEEPKVEKGLLSLVKTSQPGLYVRDSSNRWMLVDHDIEANELIVLAGLTIYQATGGFICPSLFKTDVQSATAIITADGNVQNVSTPLEAIASPVVPLAPPVDLPHGRTSLVFKFQARPSAIIHCTAMAAAGHQLAGPFQAPVGVSSFMQRTVPVEQILAAPPKAPPVGGERRKRKVSLNPNSAPVGMAPSKRLRMEAQRVLKERVQDLAETKQVKIKFCSIKECEEHHLDSDDPPCGPQRRLLGWPAGVPFCHPHDLPNRSKQMFLEAYEPGWTQRQPPETFLSEGRKSVVEVVNPINAVLDPRERYTLKSIYDFLRASSRPVPTGKPQVVGHKVDIPLLCKLVVEAGGKDNFEQSCGFQRFIGSYFNLNNASEKEKGRAVERLRKLYEQVLQDYVEHVLAVLKEEPQRPLEAVVPLEDHHGGALAQEVEGPPVGVAEGEGEGIVEGDRATDENSELLHLGS